MMHDQCYKNVKLFVILMITCDVHDSDNNACSSPGLEDVKTVMEGVKHIIADIIHKDPKVMQTVREM